MTNREYNSEKTYITEYLENTLNFRDYRFKSAQYWSDPCCMSMIVKERTICLLNPSYKELRETIGMFSKEGYSSVVVYLGEINKPIK